MPKGSHPIHQVVNRYQWLYINGFVCPQKGKTFWLLLPTVSQAIFNLTLAEFAKAEEVGKDKQIIMVVDQAGFHQGKEIIVPEGIHIIYLSPYSPELQPAEKLWSLSDEVVANRCFTDIGDLEEKLVKRCRVLEKMKEEVQARCLFHWWPMISYTN